ncbi:hypothetical protein D7Z26_15330 [Cohnella endophytica]|uniref:Uncharacterized protein n=1 Tax=Cohnella endophytica TaxID=2419778 RepID=A0A494XTG4_9BACL|nr:hypothetical protein [Cohnella endophytica]RKP53102.1 hypothetical protein D7Z26_15330 [Cohnella endophytica]
MGRSYLGIRKLCLMAVLLAVSSTFGLAGGVARASDDQPAGLYSIASGQFALTAAPPLVTNSVFNPGHLYLDNGNAVATASAGSINVVASTSALQTVDTIGVTFYLQKWNGSVWETISSGTMKSATQQSSFSSNQSYSVAAGSYYRSRTVHWIIKNGTYEEGERFSNSVLAS